MTDKTLTTGQIITLGDGRLACGIGEVYEALNGLLDDDLMTHQLPRAGRFVEPHVRVACPWVAVLPPLDLDAVPDAGKEEAVLGWVEQISAEHGPLHEVPDLSGQWIHFDPIDEAGAIFGPDRVIPIILPGSEDQA
jgi:hypothetical protein